METRVSWDRMDDRRRAFGLKNLQSELADGNERNMPMQGLVVQSGNHHRLS